jgi:hypothetical protein
MNRNCKGSKEHDVVQGDLHEHLQQDVAMPGDMFAEAFLFRHGATIGCITDNGNHPHC